MPDGTKIAKRLKRDGWTTQLHKGVWTAQHPDTTATLRWKDRGSSIQRLLDEAGAALGRAVRTTSGRNRKNKQARERAGQEAAHRARDKALAAIDADQDQQRPPSGVRQPIREVALTGTSRHALMRAKERGITGPMVQDAVVNPREIRRGAPGTPTRVFVGTSCAVLVDYLGNVVTVWSTDHHHPHTKDS